MEPIIAPVDKELIKAELTPDRFMRDTRKGGNKIYIIDCNNAPNVMREIGRLREIAFRYPGGGTGLPLDIDEFVALATACKELEPALPTTHRMESRCRRNHRRIPFHRRRKYS